GAADLAIDLGRRHLPGRDEPVVLPKDRAVSAAVLGSDGHAPTVGRRGHGAGPASCPGDVAVVDRPTGVELDHGRAQAYVGDEHSPSGAETLTKHIFRCTMAARNHPGRLSAPRRGT